MRRLLIALKIIFALMVFRALAWCWMTAETVTVVYAKDFALDTAETIARSIGYAPPEREKDKYDFQIIAEKYALSANINPSLIRAKIEIESAWNPAAISRAGAVGLMQVMPVNAKRCGLEPAELLDAEKNIACGVLIFSEDLKATQNNVVHALHRYNGGPKCIGKCSESIQHATKVLAVAARDIRG